MIYVAWLILGFALGAVLLLYARSKGEQGEKRVLTIALVVAALVYVGLAVVWGKATWILIETAGVPAFGAFVWLALRHNYKWLAAGWALHPVWDVGLHLWGPGQAMAPQWYVVACVSFDVLVATYVVINKNQRRHPQNKN